MCCFKHSAFVLMAAYGARCVHKHIQFGNKCQSQFIICLAHPTDGSLLNTNPVKQCFSTRGF